MATQDPTSTAASDALSSRGRVPPSSQSRAKSKSGAGRQSRAAKSKRGTPSQKTATPKPESPKTENQTPAGPNGYPVHSTSKLGELFDLNRATVAQRLKEHKIKPVESGPRKADYELTPEVEEFLSAGFTDPELKDAQRRTAIANAGIKEVELAEAQKRSIPRDEMFEEISAILKSLYQQFVLQMPRANAGRYAKLKTRAAIEAALKQDNAKPFLQLRANYNEIFKRRTNEKPDRKGGRRK